MGECVVAPSILPCRQQDECMRELHQELTKHMARASLQSKTRLARPSLRSWRHSHSHSSSQPWSPLARPWGQSWPSNQKKTPQQEDLGWEGNIPILGEGIGWGSARAPPLNAQAGASHPSLAFHDPVLSTSGLATPWKISTYNWDPKNIGAGHGEMMPPNLLLRETTKEETSQVSHWWGAGQWSYIASRPDPLLSRGYGWRPGWCS